MDYTHRFLLTVVLRRARTYEELQALLQTYIKTQEDAEVLYKTIEKSLIFEDYPDHSAYIHLVAEELRSAGFLCRSSLTKKETRWFEMTETDHECLICSDPIQEGQLVYLCRSNRPHVSHLQCMYEAFLAKRRALIIREGCHPWEFDYDTPFLCCYCRCPECYISRVPGAGVEEKGDQAQLTEDAVQTWAWLEIQSIRDPNKLTQIEQGRLLIPPPELIIDRDISNEPYLSQDR